MRQIRKGVFETNSSSTHSISICTQKEFNEFKSGLLVLDWKNTLIPASQKDDDCETYDEWQNGELDTFTEEYQSPHGDKIVAFGNYGYDG